MLDDPHPREVGRADHTRVVHEFGDDEVGLGVVPPRGEVLGIRLADGLEQQFTGLGDSSAEDEPLRVEDRRETRCSLAEPVTELTQGGRVHPGHRPS